MYNDLHGDLTSLVLGYDYDGCGCDSLSTEDACPILCLHGHVVHRGLSGHVGQLKGDSCDVLTALCPYWLPTQHICSSCVRWKEKQSKYWKYWYTYSTFIVNKFKKIFTLLMSVENHHLTFMHERKMKLFISEYIYHYDFEFFNLQKNKSIC